MDAINIMDIRNISDFKTLLKYLSAEMNWNSSLDDFEEIEDVTYEFDANDINLKKDEFAKIKSLKQLRPFYENQPWGIFAVEFESKRFEISSLRKILSGLIPKRRNRDHAVWDKKNLLFFCFWGEKTNRYFGAVYFEDKSRSKQDNTLPAIKTLYVSPRNEDPGHLQKFEDDFKKLSLPDLPSKPSQEDFLKWHIWWASAFNKIYKQTIKDSITLTSNLAETAIRIRKTILDIFSVETENGSIHELYNKFRKSLIHDMTKEQFADMYAQTMVYGLFSARCMSDRFGNEPSPNNENNNIFDPRQAIDNIPSTNPFLQNLLKESFSKRNKLSFDELDLGDVALLLQNTDTKSILDDFNRQTGGGREDPVIYFYEGFLNAYEKEQKKRRGVYYTPLPVVQFIVQAVDDILKNEFDIKEGLASIETKTISIPLRIGLTNWKGDIKEEAVETKIVPAIQILDPAVGTGTFLRQVILQIFKNFKDARNGQTKNSIRNQWNVYVKDHLLPRLNGFELMMAPYAVAHMKLALVLLDTDYAFDEDQKNPDRIKVFLTNSLEKVRNEGMLFEHDALAEESNAAIEAKMNGGINIVLGNPPYSGESANKGDWILSLLEDYKKEPGGMEKLQEKNPKWINDDYVKFIRYAQLYVERANSGIVAYITNHSFLDNPTFRGMRWNLLKTFDKIYIIDLHGNAKKKETCPDGSKDENVFDIQQGVSINIFIKNSEKDLSQRRRTKGSQDAESAEEELKLAEVFHYDLYGLRDDKYDFLCKNVLNKIKWNKLELSSPQYFLVQKVFENKVQYEEGIITQELFFSGSVDIATARDEFTIQHTKKEVKNVIDEFLKIDDETARKRFNLGIDVRDWQVGYARNDLKNMYPKRGVFSQIDYRPFDKRWTFYTGKSRGFHCYPRTDVMQHFIKGENIGLIIGRQGQVVGNMQWNLIFLNTEIVDLNMFYRGGEMVYPLYLYEGKKRRPNLNPKIISEIEQKLGLSFVPEDNEEQVHEIRGKKSSFTPLDLFYYIYAVLHSPKYRQTYSEFLKIDFPRVPYPKNKETFRKLCKLGEKLRKLHLLEDEEFADAKGFYQITEKVKIEKITYNNFEKKVFVNKDFFFDCVPLIAWEFYIGGYQPAQKWLKDRKGSILKDEDIRHYRKIVLALTKTAELMAEIDTVGVV